MITLSMESWPTGQENVSRKDAEQRRKKEVKKNLAPWRLCVRSAFWFRLARVMKSRIVVTTIILLISLTMAGCAFELPVVTPAPVLLSTAPPVTGTSSLAPPAPLVASDAPSPATQTVVTPTIPAPAHPTIAEALAAGLSYVQSGFKLQLPPADSFAPTQPPDLSSVEIEQALASGPWLVAISPAGVNENGLGFRTVIISNDSGKKTMRWWGRVDEYGTASTVVFTGMPRSASAPVKGVVGKIVTLPPGSAYERYFETEDGRRFGVASNKEVIKTLLSNMTEADGAIQVWGELRYAVDDYNGRRILVRKYDLKDVEPETVLARAQETQQASSAADAEKNVDLGPIAIIYEPKPRAVIHGQAQVTGEVDNPAGERILVRVELADGNALGETTVALGPPQNGVARFVAVVPFTDPPGLSQGRIAIYGDDPAAESMQLLGWQEVRFAGDVGDMRVTILQPEAGAAIRGQIQVAGQAENVPAKTLLVRVEDTAGDVLGQSGAKIGPKQGWRTTVQFVRPRTARPGVIAVYYVDSDDKTFTLLAMTPVRLKR